MFSIVTKEVKEFLRDKTNLFLFLMLPIALIFLLGNLIETIDGDDPIGKINVHYIIETKSPQEKAVIDSFISGFDEEILSFEKTDSIEASREKVKDGEITALVIFKEPMGIEITGGSNRLQNKTVYAVMDGFVQASNSISAVIKLAPMTLENSISTDNELVVEKDFGVKRSMLDYYAVAMLAMNSLFSILLGVSSFSGEKQNKTINRLIIAPKKRLSLYFQKLLGIFPQIILQILIIMAVSVFIFNSHFAGTFEANFFLILMFFAVSIALTAIGLLIALIMKTNPYIYLLISLWISMFFGRTFSKEINIEAVTPLMPSNIIQNAAFDLTIFGRYGSIFQVIIVFLIIFIMSLAAGAFVFSRMEEVR